MRWAVVILVALATSARAEVDYLRDVKPLLKEHCYACHGGLKQKGKLRLDTAASLRSGGEDGPLVAKGMRADQSPLIQRVTAKDISERMPPEGNALSGEQINLLRIWVNQGAPGPAVEKAESDPRQHWAFRRVERPAVPFVKDAAAVRNPIDAFIEQAREAKGTERLPEADKATLLRRVYLDLIGLPPTREQLRAFLADESPNAYEIVVDRLLASPQYGERWGRHWMDVWRYSDWYGRRAVPDVMNSYPTIWRWRDWIVRSLNEDKGYDRMVTEMLAADEIEPGDEANVVATGFIVRNWFKWNYNTWMRDQVEHTGKAFLGLTMNCCHCHDHKYDPITKEEYFKFRAFFEPLELRQDRVAGEPDPGPFVKYVYGVSYGPIAGGMVRVFDEKLNAKTFIYNGGDERNKVAGKAPVPPGIPAAFGVPMPAVKEVALPPIDWYPGLRPFVRAEERTKARTALAAAVGQWNATRNALTGLRLNVAATALTALEARLAADDAKYPEPNAVAVSPKPNAVDLAKKASKAERAAALAVAELNRAAAKPQQVAAADKAVAAAKEVMAVASDQYTPLSPIYPSKSTGRRTALAKWITSRDNPLAARVAVNHIWLRHFGVAIVPSTFDFGRNGKPPTNQPLLDWMAAELMDSGWKMKQLHRLIVTSEAYRMASAVPGQTSPSAAIDPDNVTLWHFNSRRMEAEVVRDSVIAIAGELDMKIGGADIDMHLGETSNRRSLYFTHHGEEKMAILQLFDAAEPTDCYRRMETIVPQQALVMANSDLTLRCARAAAKKLWATSGVKDKNRAFVSAAFEQVLTRDPSPAEQSACLAFLANQTEVARSADLAREDLVHALLNHNDFVSVR